MKVIRRTCHSTIDLVKFTLKKKKNILIFVTLLKTALGVTWQIMPTIMLITNILNLSLISSIWAPNRPQIYIYIYTHEIKRQYRICDCSFNLNTSYILLITYGIVTLFKWIKITLRIIIKMKYFNIIVLYIEI